MVPVGGNSTRRIACSRYSGSMPRSAAITSSFLIRCSSNSEIFGGGSTPAGSSYLGSASPGPHQSRCELLSFHRSQTLWERSVSSSSLGKPMTRANRSAPSPTSITWPVCSMTALASSDGSFAPCGTMHAAGVKFHYSFLVRQAAQADAVIVGIVLLDFSHRDGGIQRIAAAAQDFITPVDAIDAVRAGNQDGRIALLLYGLGLRFLRAAVRLLRDLRLQAQRERTECCGGDEIPAGQSHVVLQSCGKVEKDSTHVLR